LLYYGVFFCQGQGLPVSSVVGQGNMDDDKVATPDVDKRRQLYEKEAAVTDAELAFELLEKVLRVRLQWLMQAGGGIKATVAAAMAHVLRAAAAEGGPGEAAGGTATAAGAAYFAEANNAAQVNKDDDDDDDEDAFYGIVRAPREELLEPFPKHVLVRFESATSAQQ
jgi:hypothetical protein